MDGDLQPFEPIAATGIIEKEVGTPRNDGTHGRALYKVPSSCRAAHLLNGSKCS